MVDLDKAQDRIAEMLLGTETNESQVIKASIQGIFSNEGYKFLSCGRDEQTDMGEVSFAYLRPMVEEFNLFGKHLLELTCMTAHEVEYILSNNPAVWGIVE